MKHNASAYNRKWPHEVKAKRRKSTFASYNGTHLWPFCPAIACSFLQGKATVSVTATWRSTRRDWEMDSMKEVVDTVTACRRTNSLLAMPTACHPGILPHIYYVKQ